MMKDINVGLIGYKFMGKAHSNAFNMLPMFFDMKDRIVRKAICGRDENNVLQAAAKFGFSEYMTSWKELIKRDDIHVIDITAPSDFHMEPAIGAAEAKKHIFCEKPLALNYSDALMMYEAVKKTGVKNQIGFNYRFVPAIILAKKLIDGNKLGRIYHFRGAYLQDWIMDPDFPKVWRLDKKVAGSGALGDIGAHVVDLARFLISDIEKVSAMSETFIKQRPSVQEMTGLSAQKVSGNVKMEEVDVDDATIFLMKFTNGALGTIETTRFAGGHKNDMYFEINGEKGSIKFYFERMNELLYYNTEDEEGYKGFRLIQASESIHPYMQSWWPAGHVLGYENTFVHEFYEFFESISNNTPSKPDFYDGLKCSQVLDAVEMSVRENCWIDVNSIK